MAKPIGFIGYRALFADENYSATAQALEDSVVCSIDKDIFMDILRNNAELTLHILKSVATELGFSTNRTVTLTQKHIRGRLAESLVAEGQTDKAVQVLDRGIELIPHKIVPYNYFSIMMAETYFNAGKAEKGKEIINTIMTDYEEQLEYFFKLNKPMRASVDEDIQRI